MQWNEIANRNCSVSRALSVVGERWTLLILREADRSPVAQVAKKHGISEHTIYAWRKRYGTLEAVDVKRLRQLEQENAKLKKLVTERDLEIDVMKEVTRKKW
jgi:transposase-like protein